MQLPRFDMLELFEVGFDIILQSALDSKYRNSWHPCQTTQSGYIWLNPLSFSSTPTMMLVGRCPKQPSPQTSLCRTFPRLSDLFRFIYFQSASFLLPISIIDHRTCPFEWHTRAPVILAFSLLLLSASYLCKQPLEL